MKIDFENEFKDKILSRGYDYYKNNLVQDVHIVDDLIVTKEWLEENNIVFN